MELYQSYHEHNLGNKYQVFNTEGNTVSIHKLLVIAVGFPGGASGREPFCQRRRCKRDRLNPSENSPGEGNGNQYQYSCLENPHGQRAYRLQSMGCQRVGHDWSSLAHTHYKIYNDTNIAVLCLVVQSCPTLCKPMDCSLPGFSARGDSTGKNTGVGCHDFPQWHIL